MNFQTETPALAATPVTSGPDGQPLLSVEAPLPLTGVPTEVAPEPTQPLGEFVRAASPETVELATPRPASSSALVAAPQAGSEAPVLSEVEALNPVQALPIPDEPILEQVTPSPVDPQAVPVVQQAVEERPSANPLAAESHPEAAPIIESATPAQSLTRNNEPLESGPESASEKSNEAQASELVSGLEPFQPTEGGERVAELSTGFTQHDAPKPSPAPAAASPQAEVPYNPAPTLPTSGPALDPVGNPVESHASNVPVRPPVTQESSNHASANTVERVEPVPTETALPASPAAQPVAPTVTPERTPASTPAAAPSAGRVVPQSPQPVTPDPVPLAQPEAALQGEQVSPDVVAAPELVRAEGSQVQESSTLTSHIDPISRTETLAKAEPVRSEPLVATTYDPERAERVLNQVRLKLAPGMRKADIALTPANLGHIQVHMTVEDGEMSAVLRADRPETLVVLEQHLPELRSMLDRVGIEVREFDLGLGRGDGQTNDTQRDGDTKREAQSAQSSSNNEPDEEAPMAERIAEAIAGRMGFDAYA